MRKTPKICLQFHHGDLVRADFRNGKGQYAGRLPKRQQDILLVLRAGQTGPHGPAVLEPSASGPRRPWPARRHDSSPGEPPPVNLLSQFRHRPCGPVTLSDRPSPQARRTAASGSPLISADQGRVRQVVQSGPGPSHIPLVSRGHWPDQTEPPARLSETAELLGLPVRHGGAAGQNHNSVAAQVAELLVVKDLEGNTVLDQRLFHLPGDRDFASACRKPARESCGARPRRPPRLRRAASRAAGGRSGRTTGWPGRPGLCRPGRWRDPAVLEPANVSQAIEVEGHRFGHLQRRRDVGEGRVLHPPRNLEGADPRVERLVMVSRPQALVPKGVAAGNSRPWSTGGSIRGEIPPGLQSTRMSGRNERA